MQLIHHLNNAADKQSEIYKMCMGHCLGARYGQRLTAAASSKIALL